MGGGEGDSLGADGAELKFARGSSSIKSTNPLDLEPASEGGGGGKETALVVDGIGCKCWWEWEASLDAGCSGQVG